MLKRVGLKLTRQRIELADLLFSAGDRYLTAEALYEEAQARQISVSLATIYNTLHQYAQAGLLREIVVDGTKTYYDTNVSDHYHFYLEAEQRLIDMAPVCLGLRNLPVIPDGYEVVRVDVVARLRPRPA